MNWGDDRTFHSSLILCFPFARVLPSGPNNLGHVSCTRWNVKVLFITAGTQLASSGADGMIRVWNARDGLEAASIDAHSDRIWALAALSDGDELISGAADGTVRTWVDISERVRKEKQELADQLALKCVHSIKHTHAHTHAHIHTPFVFPVWTSVKCGAYR